MRSGPFVVSTGHRLNLPPGEAEHSRPDRSPRRKGTAICGDGRAAAAAAPGALLLTACTTGQGHEPDVRTGPDRALIDAPAEFLVEGLAPGEQAVL